MKQFRKSPIAIACYVISVLILAYCLYVCANAIGYVNQYFASMGMPAEFGVTLEYIIQSGLSPFVSAVTVFMAGFILEEVRKLNPSNWRTEDEIAEEKEAKKMAREAKQIAKGEAAKAKADAKAEAEAEARAEARAEETAEEAEAEFSAVVAEDAEELIDEAEELSDTVEEVAEETAEVAEETAEAVAEATETTEDIPVPAEEE